MTGALIWSPFATLADARQVAGEALEQNVIACANIIPEVESLFRWDGAVHSSREVGVQFKTDVRLLEQACALIARLHPYSQPVVMGWRADRLPPATLNWLGSALPNENDPAPE